MTPNDIPNKGFVDPASAALPDARFTLQLSTSTGDDLSGGSFFGGNLAFNPQAGGTSGAYTQGAWTQYSTTFTADKTGYLKLLFKVKGAANTSYPGAGVTDVKFLADVVAPAQPEKDGNISVTGKWTPCKMVVSAPANGFLWVGFKIKPTSTIAGLAGYGELRSGRGEIRNRRCKDHRGERCTLSPLSNSREEISLS